MTNFSTLIYLVNSFQSELNYIDLIETGINNNSEKFPGTVAAPKDRTIENILNFARSYEVYQTKGAGFVEMNLN